MCRGPGGWTAWHHLWGDQRLQPLTGAARARVSDSSPGLPAAIPRTYARCTLTHASFRTHQVPAPPAGNPAPLVSLGEGDPLSRAPLFYNLEGPRPLSSLHPGERASVGLAPRVVDPSLQPLIKWVRGRVWNQGQPALARRVEGVRPCARCGVAPRVHLP